MVHTINVHYLTDVKGKQTAVQIPVETWNEISEYMPFFLQYIKVRKSLEAGFREVE